MYLSVGSRTARTAAWRPIPNWRGTILGSRVARACLRRTRARPSARLMLKGASPETRRPWPEPRRRYCDGTGKGKVQKPAAYNHQVHPSCARYHTERIQGCRVTACRPIHVHIACTSSTGRAQNKHMHTRPVTDKLRHTIAPRPRRPGPDRRLAS